MSSLPTDVATRESTSAAGGSLGAGGVADAGGSSVDGGVAGVGGTLRGGGLSGAVGSSTDGGAAGVVGDVLVDVLMPKMGSSVVEGTVVEWNVAVGEAVQADQPLCVISTDKVDSECPSPASGVLAEIVVEDGETVEVGTVIGRVARRSGSASGDGAGNGGTADGSTPTRREILRRSSPVAAKIAAEHAIDVTKLAGSGRNGRVTKADVLGEVERRAAASTSGGSVVEAPDEPPMHIESPYRRDPNVPVAGQPAFTAPDPASATTPFNSAPATTPISSAPTTTPFDSASGSVPPGDTSRRAPTRATGLPDDDGTVVPLSRMRTAIGAQMRKALDTAAHATTIVECDMSRIERERRELGVTALPLVARHVLDTLREFPALNATYDGQTLTRFDRVHLGIAVSLGEDGLIVPVVHDAQELAPTGLASRIRDVATRARSGELSPDEVRGGTFTITNPGAAGALIATPILNVPQVAILDLEAIVKRAVVVTDADGQDSIAIRPMTHLCMSWDHRVLDGMYAARFLTALRGRIEGA